MDILGELRFPGKIDIPENKTFEAKLHCQTLHLKPWRCRFQEDIFWLCYTAFAFGCTIAPFPLATNMIPIFICEGRTPGICIMSRIARHCALGIVDTMIGERENTRFSRICSFDSYCAIRSPIGLWNNVLIFAFFCGKFTDFLLVEMFFLKLK